MKPSKRIIESSKYLLKASILFFIIYFPILSIIGLIRYYNFIHLKNTMELLEIINSIIVIISIFYSAYMSNRESFDLSWIVNSDELKKYRNKIGANKYSSWIIFLSYLMYLPFLIKRDSFVLNGFWEVFLLSFYISQFVYSIFIFRNLEKMKNNLSLIRKTGENALKSDDEKYVQIMERFEEIEKLIKDKLN